MTTADAYRQQQERKERLDKLAYRNVHAILAGEGFPCGGNLSVAWGGLAGRQEYVLRCAKCGILPDDTPLEKIETPYDVWKKGGIVAPWHQALYEKLERRKDMDMANEQGLTTRPVVADKALAIHDIETRFAVAIRQRELLEQYIRERLKPDKHYYTVAGGQKPSITKEGAELINLPHGLKPYYDIVFGPQQPPQDDSPYQLTVRCELRRGDVPEGQGMGSSSSMITLKTGEREQRQRDPGLRYNATLKMACKSAYNAATLSATAASEFFTQDLEDGAEVEHKPEADKTQHWCQEHNTVFFKRGNMKNYAHPIGDTGKWCNETKRAEPVKPTEAEQEFDDIPSVQPATKATGDQSDLSKLEFANAGQFYQACNDHFNLSKTQVMKEVPEFDLSNAGQRTRAWLRLFTVRGVRSEGQAPDAN